MKYLDKLVLYLSNFTSLSNKYILSICQSLIVVFIIKILSKSFEILNNKFNTDDKNKYILNKRVRLIAGCDEESGSRCLKHYLEYKRNLY